MAQELFPIGVTVVLGIIGFLAARTLNKIDRNQTELFAKYNNHETRISHLEGEHKVLHPKSRG